MVKTPISIAYLPPLRGAVIFAVGLGRGAVTVRTLASIAEVADDRAKSFATILVNLGAIVETDQGFVQGPSWSEWSARPVKSRPIRAFDPDVITEMDGMRRIMGHRVRDEMNRRGWSIGELSRQSGIHKQYIAQMLKYCKPPPACHLLVISRTLGLTIEELATPSAS